MWQTHGHMRNNQKPKSSNYKYKLQQTHGWMRLYLLHLL